MKLNFNISRYFLLFLAFAAITIPGMKAQEKIVYNGVIDWQWSPRQSLTYAGNGFYWWHRPKESPGYVVNYGQMPANDWKTPYDYENGTFYLRFEVIDQPTTSPFTIQFGIWQDVSSQKEVVSPYSTFTGGPGSSVARSIGSPSNWHQVFATDVDFTRPEDFYRIGFILWKGSGSCIPMAQGWSNSAQCPNSETEQLNYFPMRARVTVVAVASGRTFSGWNNYPPPSSSTPPTPNYAIDYANVLTDKTIPSTDEYAYVSNMSGAVSGTAQKLTLTPGQDVYFRTKANGTNPASGIQTLDVPARPAAPAFTYDAANQRTANVVTNTYEYSASSTMANAITGNSTYVSFPAGTTYYFRRKATTTAFSSTIQSLLATEAPVVVSDSCSAYLQHYWKLEENNPDAFFDYAATLHANILVQPVRIAGKVGYAQSFDGTSEASLPDNGSFDWGANASFSIEFWLNKISGCPSQTTAYNNVIIGRDDATSQLHWWAGVSCANPGRINFNLIPNNGIGQNMVSKRTVIDGNWHHVAIVRNGTQGSTSIFIDGTRDTTTNFTYTDGFASGVPINIGWLNLGGRYHYSGLLDELALYNRALSADEIAGHYNTGSGRSYCVPSENPNLIKIMPLGNSITFDNNIVDTRPVGDKVAYRVHLYNLLNHAGQQFDFVGSENGGFNLFPDAENAGFPGIRANQVTQLLNTGYNSKDAVQETPGPYLDYYKPDVILLHIGTNSVQESPVDVENILNEIDSYKTRTGKDTKVILARIINRQAYNQTTTTFNNNVAAMAIARNNPDIYFVDMENGAGFDYYRDMTDNLHPNPVGYQKMAINWFGRLSEILPQMTFRPRIEISPVNAGTANVAYTSKAYAIGNPAPSFSLLSPPAGMNINSQTGTITWTPSAIGDYSVSVRASNDLGSDTLSFTLKISGNTKTIGNTQVFTGASTARNRRAQPVSMTEDGLISSLSVYHNGGTGNAILAVYNTVNGLPGQRIAVTQATPVSSAAGWQTFNLATPVSVNQGQTIWLAWVFQNSVSVRYTSGTPGRAQSSQYYSAGMPELFGTSTTSASIYSIYATYSVSSPAPLPPAAPTSLSATAVSASQVNLSWTDNATDEQGFQVERSLTSGSGFQLVHTTAANVTSYANSGLDPNQTYYYRVRAYNEQGNSGYTEQQQVTTPGAGGSTVTLGYNQVFTSLSSARNRRAQPVTPAESGVISSISVYHNGGTGNVILAVYNTASGLPGQRIAVTQATPVNTTEGWQTVNLVDPVSVSQGETIWLAWVFQNSVSLRYSSGTPGRAQSGQYYSGGMPELFGTSTTSASIYSIYATYSTAPPTPAPPVAPSACTANAVSVSQINLGWTDNANNEEGVIIERSLSSGLGFSEIYRTGPDQTSFADTGLIAGQTYYYRIRAFNEYGYSAYTDEIYATTHISGGTTATIGNTQVFGSLASQPNRRAQPVTMSENGSIHSLAIYHQGGTGNVILAVYNSSADRPWQRIAVTPPTPVNSIAGWQTINLIEPVNVNQGDIIWLAWVFENMPIIRYQTGSPGRAQSTSLYAGGMPATFGSSSVYNTVFSIYANYTIMLKSTGEKQIAPEEKKLSPDMFEVYPTIVKSGFTIRLQLNEKSDVTLDAYTMLGIKVKEISSGVLEKGEHIFHVDDIQSSASGSAPLIIRSMINNKIMAKKIFLQQD